MAPKRRDGQFEVWSEQKKDKIFQVTKILYYLFDYQDYIKVSRNTKSNYLLKIIL